MRNRRPLHLRWLLRLYPRDYRERYADDIAGFLEEERGRGAGGLLYWVRVWGDHWAAARRVRRREVGRMGRLMQDLSWGAKGLLRSPGFTAFAALTLALGVGATAAVFTVLDRVVLRPFPYEGGERLVQVGTYILGREDLSVLSAPLVKALRDDPGEAEVIVGSQPGAGILTGAGDPARVTLRRVSDGYFPLFQGRAAAGRVLVPADHQGGALAVAVLSHGVWTERFGSDPQVVGRVVRLDDVPYEIVGVLEAGFTAPEPEFFDARAIVVPLGLEQRELDRGSFGIRTVARLEEGTPPGAFEAHMERVAEEIYPEEGGFVTGVGTRPLKEMVVGPEIGRNLWRLLMAVGLLLIIGCVNVASLLLTRASRRVSELSVRTALGATRSRLMGQLLAEGALLALLGGTFAAALAWGAVEVFRRLAPDGLPRLAEVAVDPRIFGITMVVSLGTVLIFGVVPALRASRLGSELRQGMSRSGSDRREGVLRSGLVMVETALAVALVAWSSLISADLVGMTRDDAGFRRDGLVGAEISLRGRPAAEAPEELRSFFQSLKESAAGIPGVTRVGLGSELPYSGTSLVSVMMPEGTEEQDQGEWIGMVAVMGDFLDALGARVLEGRALDPDHGDADRQVALVNESFVRRYWVDGSAVGRSIKSGGPDVDDEGRFEVVGVIADVRTAPGEEPPPKMYVPFSQQPWSRMVILLETPGEPSALVPALRERLARLDPGLPLGEVVTLDQVASEALARPRFYAGLYSSFSLIAFFLAVVGVYGTTAYVVEARSREVGIRMALGADRDRIVAGAVRRAGSVVLLGVALGTLLAAVGAGALLADTLRLIEARQPGPYLIMAALVAGVGCVAAWIPARRLSRVDPALTLRRES